MLRIAIAALAIAIAIALALPAFADETRDKAIHDATVLVDEGKVDEAIAALKKLVAEEPADTLAIYELGLAYASKGDNVNCRATLEPIADAKGANRTKILGMLGNCLDQTGERTKAIEVYRRGLKTDPDDSGLLFNLAIALIQSGKADDGRELLKHDIEKNPSHASAHLVLGQVFEAQGFYVPATLSFLHFLALEPVSPRANVAATHVMKLLNRGVDKTGKGGNINITLDSKERKEEGDYSGMQMTMALLAGAAGLEDKDTKKKPTEFEAALGQISGTLAVFSEGERGRDFTARVQHPFFDALAKEKLTEVFAGIALGTLKLQGDHEWAGAHYKEISRYFDWIGPQLARPGVQLKK